mmetsp:Transcript_61170/g.171119  ORF Transcript_61170/g.171119 Transcript_61170/m.171119 type:complete len:146 (-) Transcript_61170:99-536(-)
MASVVQLLASLAIVACAVQGRLLGTHKGVAKATSSIDLEPAPQVTHRTSSDSSSAAAVRRSLHASMAAVAMAQPEKLPEQGYVGEGVKHEDGKTITSDWRQEYGGAEAGTTGIPPAPAHSASVGRCSVSVVAMVGITSVVLADVW